MSNKLSNLLQKGMAFILCIILVCSVVAIPAVADSEKSEQIQSVSANQNTYTTYRANYGTVSSNAVNVSANLLSGDTKKTITDSIGNTYDNADYWQIGSGDIAYSVDIAESGLYNITVSYLLDTNQENNWAFSLLIDGKSMFDEMENIILPRYWTNDGKKRSDDFGNQIAPKQIPSLTVVTKQIYDYSGTAEEPYLFYLEKGSHTLTFSGTTQNVTIIGVEITSTKKLSTYDEKKKEYSENGYKEYKGKSITVQGEDAVLKSSRSLIPKVDRSTLAVTPSSADKDLLNYIGGTSWQQTGDEIIWQVEVPESGLYQLGISYLQNTVINGISYRSLKINGETPFKEADCLKFEYKTKWNYTGFFDEDEQPYLFYLEKGTQQISLTVTLGENFTAYDKLKNITSSLGDLYIDITIITGETPDVNRDYDLFKKVPDWEKRLKEQKKALSELSDYLRNISGKRGSTIIAASDNMARVLQNMLKNPYTAQIYVSDFYSCYTTLSSWLYEIKQMPLGIDEIELLPASKQVKPKKLSLFKRAAFGIKRFLVSFSEDYVSSVDNSDSSASLKIWVNWGRDQAMVLNNLIEESFSTYSEKEFGKKIDVKLELVNASLVKGILSGNAPDLALHQERSAPVNLAIRGALCDLSQFGGFDEIIKRFGDSATLPYQYNGGTYALPDQQTFNLMFYRKDILDQLGISVPNTWDEFLAATAVLQRNNMNAYIPYTKITTETTVNTGVGSLNLYPTVLQQFGGSFYNDKLNKCTLDSSVSVNAFRYWIEMYTQYKLPTEADFYNRLRLGTSPLGISPYTLYNTLSEAAPEIEGRWGIALVPGIRKENGEICRTVSGGGTGCSVLSVSKNKEAAWCFLKWWTLADTQIEYNNNVEMILGSTARVPLATVDAFEKLSWKSSDLPILTEQFSNIEEINEVPGSYYVSRAVDQAFWNVVSNGEKPKDVLIDWGNVANEEIARKIKEYS